MDLAIKQKHLSWIHSETVKAAYKYLTSSFKNIDFRVTAREGVVRAILIYDPTGRYLFSFIVNRHSLLFYLRRPALQLMPQLGALAAANHAETKQNSSGEITLTIRTEMDAFDLSLWLFPELRLHQAGSISSRANATPSQAPASPVRTLQVVLYQGHVDRASAERFLDLIAHSSDTVIGLDVTLDPTDDYEEGYGCYLDENRLVVSHGDPLNAPQEVVINGHVGRTALTLLRIDGFYLIKCGGSFAAGAVSWGALPVDEAAIRLNSHLQIIPRRF